MNLLFIGNYITFHGRKAKGNISQSEILANYLIDKGWSIKLASRKYNRFLRLLDMLSEILINKNKYSIAIIDVFSSHAFIFAYSCACLLRLIKKPVILSLHGGNLPNFASRHPKCISRLFSWADSIVAPSRYLIENLSPYYQHQIKLIPNGLEIENFKYLHREKLQPKLVWLRAFDKIYNPSLAPRVLNLVSKKTSEIFLTMIGPDKGDNSLHYTKDVASSLRVDQQITFVGHVVHEEVANWLNKSDIFINTTNIDNTPLSVIEAMACGLCIVSTNVGGIPFLLDDGIDALLVDPDDPQAMAKCVLSLLFDPELSAKLSKNARKKAEMFSWNTVLPLWENLFTSLSK